MMMLLREAGGNLVSTEYTHYPLPARTLACSHFFAFGLLKINPEKNLYDTILFAFIPSNCSLQKIILIFQPPWNELSE